MTQIIGKNIKGKCPKCGNDGEVDLYESVNVTVNPELLEAVKNRKINSFHCEKCGNKIEIMVPFLYHDMNKNLMVWVYPEGEEGREMAKAAEKAQEEDKSQIAQLYREMKARLSVNAYGFDELFKLMEEKRTNKERNNQNLG
jgi:transcription elongation factor Elf1